MIDERLLRLSQLGDTGAAKTLLTAASRQDNLDVCMDVFQTLFEAGLWETVITWLNSRIYIHEETQDTAWICNHLKRIFALSRQIFCPNCGGTGATKTGPYANRTVSCGECLKENWQNKIGTIDESKLPPAQDVLDLWGKSINAWWPDGWTGWLAKQPGWTKGAWRVWFGYGDFFFDNSGNAEIGEIFYDDEGKISEDNRVYPNLPDIPNCICDNKPNKGLCIRCGKNQ